MPDFTVILRCPDRDDHVIPTTAADADEAAVNAQVAYVWLMREAGDGDFSADDSFEHGTPAFVIAGHPEVLTQEQLDLDEGFQDKVRRAVAAMQKKKRP